MFLKVFDYSILYFPQYWGYRTDYIQCKVMLYNIKISVTRNGKCETVLCIVRQLALPLYTTKRELMSEATDVSSHWVHDSLSIISARNRLV